MTIALILIAIVIAGCGSVVSKTPTSAPQSRSAADVRADETQCESYAKSQPKIRDRSTVDHYTVCMIARGYGANFYFDELGLRLSVRQTRTHDAATVMTDMNDCDKQGDNTKATEVV